MARIPLVCVALLLASVFAMQLTSQQTNVFYIPATEGPVKVRPANLTGIDYAQQAWLQLQC